jgi:hypothetical protein
MTTTPFEPSDSPEDRVSVDDLEPAALPEGSIVSEDPDVETPTIPPEEDVAPGAGDIEPTD